MSQAVSRASKEADKQAETHSLAFFWWQPTSTSSGEHCACTIRQWSRGRTLTRRPAWRQFESRLAAAGVLHHQPISLFPGPWFKSFKTQTFDPPPKKMWYPVSGGYRALNQKIHWGIVLSGKIMILQGVEIPISCLGVCYTNDPLKGGCVASAPTLDLTTSLRDDFLRRLWHLVFSMLFGASDPPPPQGGGCKRGGGKVCLFSIIV